MTTRGEQLAKDHNAPDAEFSVVRAWGDTSLLNCVVAIYKDATLSCILDYIHLKDIPYKKGKDWMATANDALQDYLDEVIDDAPPKSMWQRFTDGTKIFFKNLGGN